MDSLVMGRTCSGPLFMQLLFYSKSKAEKLVRLPAKQPVLLLFIVYEKRLLPPPLVLYGLMV